jgi:hypothetical protein
MTPLLEAVLAKVSGNTAQASIEASMSLTDFNR